jgi:hypothetical protein
MGVPHGLVFMPRDRLKLRDIEIVSLLDHGVRLCSRSVPAPTARCSVRARDEASRDLAEGPHLAVHPAPRSR